MPQSMESTTNPPTSPSDIIVFFFCKELDHNPSEFVSGRNYECRLCPLGRRDNWAYYCTACEGMGSPVCHYAAKHINNHVNNIHEGRNVKRRFANNEQQLRIQEYKMMLASKKNTRKARRGTKLNKPGSPMEIFDVKTTNNYQPSLCELIKQPPQPFPSMETPYLPPMRVNLVNSTPSKFPIAGRTLSQKKLVETETPSTINLHQRWARLIYLGSMASLIRYRLKSLMDRPHEQEQILILQSTFNTFLGHAMNLFPEEGPPNTQLRNLASMVTTAISSGNKITENILNEFRETSEVIQKDIMSKGCGNFLLLGDLLLNSDSKVYKNNPRIFLNGMYVTLDLPTNSPVYECERLFHVLNNWCRKYGVELENEVLQAIRVESPRF